MLKKLISFLKHLCTTEAVIDSDFNGDYVEINGERHYHNGSEKIKFKNFWVADVKESIGL